MSNRNYSSIHSMKSFVSDTVIPNYFGDTAINQTSIGLMGIVTEVIGNATEDSINTLTTYLNEIFPSSAILPESIYNYAAMTKLDEILATPSKMSTLLLVSEEDVLSSGKRIDGEVYEFYLDSNTIIKVEDIEYHPAYDIRITYRRYKNEFVYIANYDMKKHGSAYSSTIAGAVSPYIKLKKVYLEGKKYLMMQIDCYQITKYTMNESVLSTDSISIPSFNVEYEGMLANLEVFYKAPNRKEYVQLIRKQDNSTPETKPFFYYRQTDKTVNGGMVEIFFSSRDKYFKPEPNTDIIIEYSTTTGKKADFEKYTGNNVIVIPNGEKYEYNDSLVLFAYVPGGSKGGKDVSDFETVRQLSSEALSTLKSYTTENDLMLYFQKYTKEYGNTKIIPIKKRDDIGARIFSAFMYFTDKNKDIIHTNTTSVTIKKSDFDSHNTQTKISILKPNHIYKYNESDDVYSCSIIAGEKVGVGQHSSFVKNNFYYACPYTILFTSSPTSVGYFLTTVNETKLVDYEYINEYTTNQFICSSFNIKRDSVREEYYTVTVTLSPVSKLPTPLVKNTGTDDNPVWTKTNQLVVRVGISSGQAIVGEIDCTFDSYDLEKDIYTFTAKIKTDDTITVNNNIKITNLITLEATGTFNTNPKLIPMENTIVQVSTYYKETESSVQIQEDRLVDTTGYILTNKYTTDTSRVNFVYPINTSRSDAIYNDLGGGDYSITITDVPLVEYKVLENKDNFWEFNDYLYKFTDYLNGIKYLKTNNYGMDVKFYNTYGKSKNFTIGDTGETTLNRVNLKIHFEVKPIFGTDTETLVRDIKEHIKSLVESINTSSNGSNAIYVSNIIQSIENKFPAVSYMKFKKINEYTSDIQVIENNIFDLTLLDKKTRIHYTPEYLTIHSDDIIIDII